METVSTPPSDVELDLLLKWDNTAERPRARRAAILSIGAHLALIGYLSIAKFEATPLEDRPRTIVRVTPLVEPLTRLTQPEPNPSKKIRDFNATEITPRDRIQVAPDGPGSTTRPRALRPAPIPIPPAPGPVASAPPPEPPKIDAPVKEAPKVELPQTKLPAPPAIQAEERPQSPFENLREKPVVRRNDIPLPDTSLSSITRDSARGTLGGGQTVGEAGAGIGGLGRGVNMPPAPGAPGSQIQLLSDPMGVDFKPYLAQILQVVRRNWFTVMPESVRLGQSGRVSVLFSIARNGVVAKVTYASQSGIRALDQAAIAAISMSNPLPALPSDFKSDRIVLQLNFAYNVPK